MSNVAGIERLLFFHGTDAHSARNIISGLDRNEKIAPQTVSAAAVIVPRIERAPMGYAQAFFDADCKHHSTAPVALRNLAQNYSSSLFAYGPFFATLDPRSAYKYALRGGSEALQCLQAGIAVTEWLGDPVDRELRTVCPDLFQEIDALSTSYPVVLCLTGISADRLTQENGGAVTSGWLELMVELVTEPGYSQPATVRISDVRPPDVRSVHDLGGHTAIDDAIPFFDKGWSLPPEILPSRWLEMTAT